MSDLSEFQYCLLIVSYNSIALPPAVHQFSQLIKVSQRTCQFEINYSECTVSEVTLKWVFFAGNNVRNFCRLAQKCKNFVRTNKVYSSQHYFSYTCLFIRKYLNDWSSYSQIRITKCKIIIIPISQKYLPVNNGHLKLSPSLMLLHGVNPCTCIP